MPIEAGIYIEIYLKSDTLDEEQTRVKASDYIVDFLILNKITDVFGYPGGMVTHFMDSLGTKADKINTHINYHEQAAAFAACGFAQASGKVGVAFATSGPGATNLLTGIGHAFFDSIPTVFITGQVNTFESKGENAIRQKGFQETDIVSMAKPITKAAFYVESVGQLPTILDKAFKIALSDRKGPVLVDIPMNVFRGELENDTEITMVKADHRYEANAIEDFRYTLAKTLKESSRPCILIGNGIKIDNQIDNHSAAILNS